MNSIDANIRTISDAIKADTASYPSEYAAVALALVDLLGGFLKNIEKLANADPHYAPGAGQFTTKGTTP